jgi:hypothetical protein
MDTYLAGKDDDLLHGSGSLVFQELLNDVDTESTGADDGEVCVSRHELTLVFVVCKPWGLLVVSPPLFILFLSHAAMRRVIDLTSCLRSYSPEGELPLDGNPVPPRMCVRFELAGSLR